jgi:single-stranded DNA-binding protein
MRNHVEVEGIITSDPAKTLKYTTNGKPYCKFFLNMNDEGKGSGFPATAWEGVAEDIANNYPKGVKVSVEGHLFVRSWKKEEGGFGSEHGLVVDSIKPLGEQQMGGEPNFGDDEDIPF